MLQQGQWLVDKDIHTSFHLPKTNKHQTKKGEKHFFWRLMDWYLQLARVHTTIVGTSLSLRDSRSWKWMHPYEHVTADACHTPQLLKTYISANVAMYVMFLIHSQAGSFTLQVMHIKSRSHVTDCMVSLWQSTQKVLGKYFEDGL